MVNKNLSRFGYSFQTKLIAGLLTDAIFVSQIYDVLKGEYFENDSIKWVVNKVFSYYNQYKRLPTLDVLKVYSDKLDDDLARSEIVNILRDSVKNVEASDLDFVKDRTINFCKEEEIKSAILQSVEFLKSENYDKIKDVIDKAYKVGISNDIGLNYLEDIETRYNEDARSPITTGWPVLDNLMKGGLSYGELGVFIASSGAGKSWLLSHIGSHAIRNGKTVFHYTLELNESYTGLRYDAIISGIPLDKIKLHTDKLGDILSTIPGKLYIKWFAQRVTSLMKIRSHIDKMKLLGTTPDLIIIDYADLLKYSGTLDDKTQQLTELYEELRGFAGELKLPVWTVSQANREGLEDDILEANKISGAYGKIFTADFVASISRKRTDKISNTARMHIIKNRFGADGMTFPMLMDTNRGLIEIYNELSEEGRKTQRSMLNEETITKLNGRKKYEELMANSSKSTSKPPSFI